MATITGAKVSIVIESESKRRFTFKLYNCIENCAQSELSSVIDFQSNPPIPQHHTPSKGCKRTIAATNPTQRLPPVEQLPGKKAKSVALPVVRTVNRCKICNVIYGSKEYVASRKIHGFRNDFMGCIKDDCDYWVHVRCTDYAIKKKSDIHINIT